MRKEKQLLLDEISEQMDDFGSFVILSYLGLTANQSHDFRRKVRATGGNVEVMSKRMLVIAAKKSGYELNLNSLTGHIGVVFTGQDPIETTKVVYEYAKTGQDKLQVVGGQIDGEVLNADEMVAFSKLPGKDQMRAQLLATLQAPLVQSVSTMNALVASMVYLLDNKSKQSEGQE